MRVYGISRLGGLALAAGLAVAMVGADAVAWSSGSWGSSGSYGSSGSSASYGSSGSSASYGSYGRVGLFARIRARRAARHASHGSYGSYGSSASYGSYGSHGSSGSHGSHGSYGTPVYRESDAVAQPDAVNSTTSNSSIKVTLPENAKVYVNDAPTTSTGTERSYLSRGLRRGMTYTYEIRVEYEQDGQTVSEDQLVKLSAGETVSLSFGQAESQADEPVQTEVKVQVPEDATVFLSDSPTKQTGKLRAFSTSKLAAGQLWEDYTVRVEVVRDGQTLVREKKLKVEGGGSYELAFSFDSAATAQLAQLGK
jgi:uncharacterized protein (TIGR03000 family)